MSLLEQDNTKKKQIDKNAMELNVGNKNSKDFKVEPVHNSMVYTKELKASHLLELHYLVS